MRTIVKGQADPALAQQHQSPPQTSEDATIAWNYFRNKKETRGKCLVEQYYLCGYSEIALENHIPILDDRGQQVRRNLGVHLEHVQPKNIYPCRTFDHKNLIVCAIDQVGTDETISSGLSKEEAFGGHAKGNWYSQDFISPFVSNCRDYFFFDAGTGKVSPSKKLSQQDRDKTELTICRLNLNSPVLMLWRRTWLAPLNKEINEFLKLNDISGLQKFCAKRLLPDNGKLSSFHSAQRLLFGSMGVNVCAQHNPPL